jgi:hypothetical protein
MTPILDSSFPVRLGLLYTSSTEFKNVDKNWSIADNFVHCLKHSDRSQVMTTCRKTESCPFFLCCNYVPQHDHAVVIHVDAQHTCFGVAPPSRLPVASLSGLLCEVPKVFDITGNTSSRVIVYAVRLHFGQLIPVRQAQRVKGFALHDTFAQHCEQFYLLPAYLEALSEENDEVYHFLQVDDVNF